MATEPNCHECGKRMQFNKYVRINRGMVSYTFACYKCGVVRVLPQKG